MTANNHDNSLMSSSASGLLEVTSVDEFSSLLTFVRLESHHAGNYTCVAENDAGRTEHTAQITVKGIQQVDSGKREKGYTSHVMFSRGCVVNVYLLRN